MHLVVFKTAEGKSAFHQTESLDDALRFVERVRNNEGVNDAHLYRMTEIPLEIRTYYKVEIASNAAAAAPPPPGPGSKAPVDHGLDHLYPNLSTR